jgi:hypothetical protein
MSGLGAVAGEIGGNAVFRGIWKDTMFILWDYTESLVANGCPSRSCTSGSTVHLLKWDLQNRWLSTIAHELGHVWDYRTKPSDVRVKDVMDKERGGLWQAMAERTGSHWAYKCARDDCERGQYTKWVLGPDSPGSTLSYARASAFEDWAMSFELWVTRNLPGRDREQRARTYNDANWQPRSEFVEQQVNRMRRQYR